ncbi:MAG: carboxymuconolactone decarboxylase family protein [Chloroflexi bacterium]|nr:carboxymuconolactone decarboxylase family protein [Chloroflexota bacterium]
MRVTPITTREQVAQEYHYAYDEVVATYNGRVVGPLRVLFYCPELARRVSSIGAAMRLASPFPAARELAIIAAAREWDCLYEWFAHEPGAKRTGVSEAAIEAVRHNKALTGVAEEEAQVVQYVRSLLRTHRVPSPLFKKMAAKFGVPGVMELTATVGFYQIFACVMNAFEVPGDTPIDLPIKPRKGAQPEAELRPYHGQGARIPLIASKDGLSPEQQSAFDDIAASRGGRLAGPFQALLHLPEVARRAAHAGSAVRFDSPLAPDVRELTIIAAARENECAYELSAHIPLARQAGVAEDVISVVEGGKGVSSLPPAEAQVISFVRELLRANRISEETYQAALGRFGLEGLVQFTTLIGYYSMLACVMNAVEVQPG